VAEDTAYFQSIVANRALLLDEQEALEGGVLVSIETAEDQQQQEDIWVWLQEHFAEFLRLLRHLSKEDQELLLSYYLLGKTQSSLATIHHSTQTVCSFKIRMAVKNLCVFLMMGEPTPETMHDILVDVSLEYSPPLKLPLSQLVWEYARSHDFAQLARVHRIHRPDIRRAMSRASLIVEAPGLNVLRETPLVVAKIQRTYGIVLTCSWNPATLSIRAGRTNNDSDFEICHLLAPLNEYWEPGKTANSRFTAPLP
jgi:hypothetical protein